MNSSTTECPIYMEKVSDFQIVTVEPQHAFRAGSGEGKWLRSWDFTSPPLLSTKGTQFHLFHSFFYSLIKCFYDQMGFPGGSSGKESAGGPGSIPGSGRSHIEGNGYQLQFSFLANSMAGAWWAIARGVAESDTTESLALHCSKLFTWIIRSSSPSNSLR